MGNGGGSNIGDGGDDPEGGGNVTTNRVGRKGEDRGREFTLAKSSNIFIPTFSKKNLNSIPYLLFNKSL